MRNLEKTKAVVLGGTSGIGQASARALAAAGADVVAASRRESTSSIDARISGEQVDVRDREALAALFARHAPIDILVNAATGGERATGPFAQMDLDGFRGSFDKLWGYVNSVRLALEHMSEDGCIVLVSGFPARKCPPGMSAIASVGGAVEAFVRAVAPEIAPRRINAVSPGIIDTPMFTQTGSDRASVMERATGNFVIKRPGTAEEVAEGVMFLVGNTFVTGTIVDVDGGALLP